MLFSHFSRPKSVQTGIRSLGGSHYDPKKPSWSRSHFAVNIAQTMRDWSNSNFKKPQMKIFGNFAPRDPI